MNQLEQFNIVFNVLGSPIHIFSKSPGGVIGGKVYSPEMLQRWVGAASRPEDFYVCLNPSTTTRIKPRIEDITKTNFWLVDLDPLDPKGRACDACYVYDHIVKMFGFMPIFYRVFSGRGTQLWFPIDDGPEDPYVGQSLVKGCSDELIRRADKELRSMGTRIDEACAEVSHLARLPGTVNTKTGERAVIFETPGPGRNHGDCFLTSMVMEQYASSVTAPLVLEQYDPSTPPTSVQILRWWNGLTPYNRAFVQNGVSTSVESRHRRATATARQLRDLGCAPDVALGWLLDGAQRCQPRLDGLFINRLHRETFK